MEEPQAESKPNGHGALRAAELAQVAEIRTAASALIERLQFARQAGITFNGMRDLYEVLGYLRIISNKDYRDRYDRGGIAGRIVEALPNATWRGEMELIEDEDPEHDTPFEQAWNDFARLRKVTAVLRRADILSRLSPYAVLLIGAPGDMGTELKKGKPGDVAYLTPFAGGGGPGQNRSTGRATTTTLSGPNYVDATIQELVTDPHDERFGQPLTYQLRRLDVSSPELERPVHWSRVIHLAEECLDNEVYGRPVLERCWNLLDDLDKVTGGGSEAFWLRANQGLHLNIDRDMKLDPTEKEKLHDMADEYQHSLRRMLQTRGVEINALGSDVANFSNPADAILTQIAGTVGIPKRILTGSEMGELASSQDRDNWKDQVDGRQQQYAAPYIVRPLVDRLIKYGYLPEPAKGPDAYDVKWPHVQTLTEGERSTGAKDWASVNSTQGSIVFTPAEIRDKWYGLAPLTPEQIKEATPEPPPAPEPPAVPGPEPEEPEIEPETGEPVEPKAAEDRVLTPDEVRDKYYTAEGLDEELLRILTAAIECNNTDVIDRIVGIEHPDA